MPRFLICGPIPSPYMSEKNGLGDPDNVADAVEGKGCRR